MQRLCSLSDLTPGEGTRIDTVSPPVAVFLTADGDVHAIDDTCTHQDASLAQGWLDGCAVECPLHASSFSLTTGAVDQPPARFGVRVHRVEVIDDVVWAELSDAPAHLPPGVSL
ncbi:bifunctional 3-phenylpropionate/cinnamic acid dioxygenase ferredoxin subunit [Microbacterium thalassium]|uniref:3-phenylpropionate/trans-cinnamate dioxygenase ferredoxin subunit n=1 Tax=Microbacterium thalassium TaxID=362649 RepID=A0A7X0FQK5_9MICO|nr:bifunctional 3-phenylpropionate/cinnamic acid dioxygenase ferredoxin subunit [Microbacterium thalassium]MBB6391375.1 3-phenylpropionate/trans-cinnamate dioxygenase ferredoxin subunit [Microbacterium thalassium]GLK23327.1 bifunctional 3-phenylpropionate/cinnamic acid dioxygenase ferredoxin subunit [Microbacterium thalassium]